MEKMVQKTVKELYVIINDLNIIDKEAQDKLSYGAKKVLKAVLADFQSINEEIQDINVKHCWTDKDGVIIHDEKGQYKYKKEDFTARKKELKSIDEKTIDIKPFIVTEESCPRVKDIPSSIKESLNGILFNYTDPFAEETV